MEPANKRPSGDARATVALSPVGALVRRHDRDRFLTTLFAPAQARESLLALYAFNYEVAKIHESVRETMLGRIRLQWWREAVAAIYDGAPVRPHEVTGPLAAAVGAHGLSRAHLDALIDAREADLDNQPPATLAALEAYAAATSGSLVLLALEAVGVREPVAEDAGREVGIAYGLAGLLRAVPFHASARRLYLPADLIDAAGIDVERGLFSRHRSPALAGVAEQVAGRARFHLAAARTLRRRVPREAVPALLPAVLAARTLERLANARYDLFAPALARPSGGDIVRLALASFGGRY